MRPADPRLTCRNCHKTLPRAASHRCPFCQEPRSRSIVLQTNDCPDCNRPIPRAHAGQCPSCAVAKRDFGMSDQGRRLRR